MKKVKMVFVVLLIALMSASVSSDGALRPAYWKIFCIDLLPEFPTEIFVPVGCEVIDCCPGCPGPIDWRIRYEEVAGIKLLISFSNSPKSLQKTIKLKGNAKWISENQLLVSGGESYISGFEESGKDIIMGEISFADTDKAVNADADKDKELRSSLSIEQIKGNYIVFDASYKFIYRRCRWIDPPIAVCDKVRLNNNTGNDQAVVLFDANTSGGCLDDNSRRTSSSVCMGVNLLANAACNAETFVFSDDNSMALRVPSTEWTSAVGDLQTFNLTGLIQVPVTFWVIDPNGINRVTNDVARANQLFNEQHVGVVLVPDMRDMRTNNQIGNFMSTTFGCAAQELTNLTGSAFFIAGRINVYYVNGSADGNRGINCTQNRNVSVVGTGGDNESMAHELGHAFSLGHTNTVTGIPTTNLMITGGTGRNSITEGQAFRVNMNPGSVLNANGTRTGITRSCADGTTSAQCPSLALDILPN